MAHLRVQYDCYLKILISTFSTQSILNYPMGTISSLEGVHFHLLKVFHVKIKQDNCHD
jgi:hypothetical protein